MKVLVMGSSGQLGQSIRTIAKQFPELNMFFADSIQGDVTNPHVLNKLFEQIKPDYCINAAAYTNVDLAEKEILRAELINVAGAANLARSCAVFNTVLVQISTDFVFSGSQNSPYKETDSPDPQGIYGRTKYAGELLIQEIHPGHFIIRTSWLYSKYGKNFMKTMLRLGQEHTIVRVVSDQRGTPTFADDLSHVILKIILSGKREYGLYHFSNEGEASWYDFAKKIFELNHYSTTLQPIPTDQYPTPARRPKYSVLDKDKIKKAFGLVIPHWEDGLVRALASL